MSDETSTSQWISFFKEAGLPANVAANYAIIFFDNRIQLNMLMDLTKEYLYDMGIRTMGDVIAILKHAKEFHTELAKAKMIGDISQLSSPKQTSPASRMLGRLTRPAQSAFKTELPSFHSTNAPSMQSSTERYSTSRMLGRLSRPAQSSFNNESSPSHSFNVMSVQTSAKRSYPVVSKPSTVISLKKTAPESFDESVAKRIRRVLPEEEGSYNIKMPTGNTERSRKILQKQQLQLGTKKSVFARLGDSDVSSSTDIQKSKTTSSVFDRLGSSNEVSTSTSPISTGKIKSISDQPLQYQGVLKKNTVRLSGSPTKLTVTRRLGSKPAVTSSQNTRIVFKSSRELRSSGVTRINEILRQHAKSVGQGSGNIRKLQTDRISGGIKKNQVTGRSVLNRLGGPPVTKTISSSGRLSSRLERKTVFDRLGN